MIKSFIEIFIFEIFLHKLLISLFKIKLFDALCFSNSNCVFEISKTDAIDVEELEFLKGEKLVRLKDINNFFINAYKLMKKEQLFIWGIYPVRNPFFMYNELTFDLRFIIGVTFGFIVRHDKKLKMSTNAETKEDYEQTILYYKMDGGVIRFNNITAKTKFNSPGGLGTDRFERNNKAAEYLVKKYPDIVTRKYRKDGTPEVKLTKLPYIKN